MVMFICFCQDCSFHNHQWNCMKQDSFYLHLSRHDWYLTLQHRSWDSTMHRLGNHCSQIKWVTCNFCPFPQKRQPTWSYAISGINTDLPLEIKVLVPCFGRNFSRVIVVCLRCSFTFRRKWDSELLGEAWYSFKTRCLVEISKTKLYAGVHFLWRKYFSWLFRQNHQ